MGQWLEGTSVINHLIHSYFTILFTSEVYETDPNFLAKVKEKVTVQMNEMLLNPYSSVEVKNVIDSIGDLKASGPDGLHAIFYKKILACLLGRYYS